MTSVGVLGEGGTCFDPVSIRINTKILSPNYSPIHTEA